MTAPALLIVGILMAQQLKGIEWDNLVYAASGLCLVITTKQPKQRIRQTGMRVGKFAHDRFKG